MNSETISNKLEDITVIVEKIVNLMGESMDKKYSKGKYLGKGGFAKCYEFKNLENNKIYAAKIICKKTLKNSRHKQKLFSEIKIHRSLNHNNIVKFEHVFEDNKNVYILLELCTNQTLDDLIKKRKRISEFETKYYIFHLVNVLKYLKKNRIIHRDLKVGNIFLSENLQIKLGDFGLAARLDYDTDKRHTTCGTPNYIAPEILSSKIGHSFEVDIWSLGVIIYIMVVGKPPFESPEPKMTYEKIKKCLYNFPDNINWSKDIKDLISSILVISPSDRLSLDKLLEHPFWNNGQNVAKTMHISTLTMPPTKNMIEQMLGTVKNLVNQNLNISLSKPKIITKEKFDNEIYIKKWVDYSSKYGIGYLLTNGNTGVFFNDNSKIIYDLKKEYFEYIEKINSVFAYTFKNYPKELHKKVTLLLHFRSYWEGTKTFSTKSSHDPTQVPNSKRNLEPLLYLKKWLRTKYAFMLRLSSKIVQVSFNDKTELILNSETKLITYINKDKEKSKYPINIALESDNKEITKRLK